jgi:sulfatase modifying factor 1
MYKFDRERLALESASGGKNTLILDDVGLPSVMVRIPKCRWSDIVAGGPDTTCSAFIIDGVEHDEIFISKYHNVVEGGRAYSIAGRDPAAFMNIDQAKQYCEAKGDNWHLLTNAEYMLLAHWCKTNGTMPHGNNWCGRDIDHKWEHGVKSYDWLVNSNWNNLADSFDGTNYHHTGRTLTGSGPASWYHDNTTFGVDGLNGNVWDWCAGMRVQSGEIQIIPDNNAAKHIDQSATSTLWKAILQDGSLVAPGTANTLKFNSDTAGNNSQTVNRVGAPILDTANDKPAYTGGVVNDDFGYIDRTFETLTAKSGVTVPQILKNLGLFPVDGSLGGDYFGVRNYGERLPIRGGSWSGGANAGVFYLGLYNSRALSGDFVGFRSAFVKL